MGRQEGGEGAFADLARAWWLDDLDAYDEVDRIVRGQQERLPSLLRSLADCAPDGALSYIGVTILEDLSDLAHREGSEDLSMDVLIAAGLSPADTFEILSGPYPEFLNKWSIRERFSATFSTKQFEALENWAGRLNRRLVLDGSGVRLVNKTTWFQSSE